MIGDINKSKILTWLRNAIQTITTSPGGKREFNKGQANAYGILQEKIIKRQFHVDETLAELEAESKSEPAEFTKWVEQQRELFQLRADANCLEPTEARLWKACDLIESQAEQLKEYRLRYAESVRKSVEIAGERRILKKQLAAKDKEIEKRDKILAAVESVYPGRFDIEQILKVE